MAYKSIKLSFFLFLFSACALFPPRWSKTNPKIQPMKKEYKLSKNKFIFSNVIDTNSVYITENEWDTSGANGKKIGESYMAYGYMRFGGNGVVFHSSIFNTERLTDADFNSLKKGQYGFYVIRDSVIMTERYNHNTNMFEYEYARVQQNGDLFIYKQKGRPWWAYIGNLKYIYRKTPANLSTKIIFPE
jgi:hypothetical protein